jgi:hypothetical protein
MTVEVNMPENVAATNGTGTPPAMTAPPVGSGAGVAKMTVEGGKGVAKAGAANNTTTPRLSVKNSARRALGAKTPMQFIRLLSLPSNFQVQIIGGATLGICLPPQGHYN